MTQTSDLEARIKVSVVIPAYQASSTIIRCLDALREQDFSLPYEIIVVDDGSMDNTAEFARTSCDQIITHREKRGAAAARNSGIRAAKGDLICFTDADCMPKKDWITKMVLPFENPEIVGAKGVYRTNQTEITARFVQIEYEDKYDLLQTQERINFIDTYSAAYRRDVLIANDGFDEQVFYVEDQELSFRLASRGYQMVFQPSGAVYHLHSNTVRAYLRKKFMIGYWKAQILRRFPGRAIQDSHTPQVLKVQILILALILTSAAALLITRWSGIALTATILAFLISTIPFLAKAWPKDRMAAIAAPFLLAIRAGSLGFGYAWGLIKPQPDMGREHTIDGFNYIVKRGIDIIGSLLGLIFTLIIAPVIAIAIKSDTKGPVIYKQERIGMEGRPFILYKFRSMYANAELELANFVNLASLTEPVFKRKDDPRLTRVGRLLRRWSLDELPQFWNVLKGDMSLVGPRPEESYFVEMYEARHRRRLAVKPGMTGPMQVNGRADLSLDARVTLDLDYIENYSVWRDIVILIETPFAVIRGSGAR